MGKLQPVTVVVSAMWALPAFGQDAISFTLEPTLAQLELCVGPDCRYRDQVNRDDRYNDGGRYQSYNWRYYRGGACRDVEVHEQRAGEVVIRHVRRCD